jgi:glycosyltransferase involved in cell wall biosynthesis
MPARDEAGSIAEVIRRLRLAMPSARVIVADNASRDGTAAVAVAAGATVVHCSRAGYGYAAEAATRVALEVGVIVYMDADGSMPPEEVPRLIEPVLRGEADIVLGRRLVTREVMPWHQRAGNRVIAALLRRRGIRAGELGPFRAVRATTLAGLGLQGSRYAWHAEMLARAAVRGARIVEVPVAYAPRTAGRSKVGGSLRGSVLATWDIGRALLGTGRG